MLFRSFKRKTSHKAPEDDKADLEAAGLASRPDSTSPVIAPRIAKTTDKAVTRRCEDPANPFDAEHAKYLGQEETDFQRDPGLRGSVD